MLREAYEETRNHYYDPTLHGLDWDGRYKQYQGALEKANGLNDGLRVVASFLSGLKDSHVFFVPPGHATRYDSGYKTTLIENRCFVTQVRPKSDAATKLRPGDEVVKVDGYNVNRQDYHDLMYFLNVLAPQPSVQLDLRAPEGMEGRAVVNSQSHPAKPYMDLTTYGPDWWELSKQDRSDWHANRTRIKEEGDVAIWRISRFDLEIEDTEWARKILRKHKAAILDLRGNPGGSVESLELVLADFFDHDVKIADQIARKGKKAMMSKHDAAPFAGQLILLVDAASASAAELAARVVQIEHRGTVLGDRSSGAVMESKQYEESQGADVKIFYGFSITEANLVMSDGKSLEGVGVTPDELVLPTAADLAAGRDPAMVRAAELAGLKLDPVEAGKLFPYEWPPL